MSILDSIKKDIKNSGKNKGKIVYFKDGIKRRIRFLCEFDDGMEVTWHDSYKNGINTPCLELFGKNCKYCGNSDLRTRNQYIWSVWDYDANKVKILLGAVNNCSPIPLLAGFYENYGTMLDRDYIIEQKGTGTNRTFSVVPCDKVKFTNKKASPLSESAIKNILKKAYIDSDEDTDDDDDDDFKETKKSSKSKAKDDDEDDDIPWENEDTKKDENDYKSMSTKELYKLCKKRKIDVEQKMKEKYYITKLKEADKAKDEWEDDDDEDDEWGDDDE